MLPSTFIFNDFICCILPTIIALCLFFPFYPNIEPKLQDIILFAAILGYLINSIIARVTPFIYNKVPYIKRKIKEVGEHRKWSAKNWDFDIFFYSLEDKDREFLFLTRSYKGFYENVSFYFLLYFILNIYYFLRNITTLVVIPLCTTKDLGKLSYLSIIYSIKTSLLGNIQIPTLFIIPISLIFFYYLFDDYLGESENLIRQNDNFAKKYHRKNGDIAVSIWGKIIKDTKSAPNVEVELLDKKCNLIDQVHSDSNGLFQFEGKYKENISKMIIIRVVDKQVIKENHYQLNEKEVPYFEIKIK
jgi:hypothetical protein